MSLAAKIAKMLEGIGFGVFIRKQNNKQNLFSNSTFAAND
jgi:hypothetical protein